MKRVGVIGGVGPEASNKFCELLIKNTPAKKDQDNIPFIHFCNPQIPDRTDYIVGKGPSPVDSIVETANLLEHAGADFLVIPCNTAHYFLPEVQKRVEAPIIDMTKVLVKSILKDNPHIQKIGILATTGSIEANIYQGYFKSLGIKPLIPNNEDQRDLVMGAIYGDLGIKAGKKIVPKNKLLKAAKKLISEGAEALVLGCTEIPLVLKQKDFRKTKIYDPMELTAREIVRYLGETTPSREITSVQFVLRDYAQKIGRILSESVDVEVVVE